MKFGIGLLLLFFSLNSFGQVLYSGGIGVLANDNNNNADTDVSVREKVSFSWYAGSRILYTLKDVWAVRTGLGFEDKSALYSYENAAGDGDVRLSVISMSVPLQVQWKLHQYFSPFAGYAVDFNLNDDCDIDGSADDCPLYGDMKSVIHHAVLGGSFHIHEKWDMDISYQRALNETFIDVKIHSFGLKVFYHF